MTLGQAVPEYQLPFQAEAGLHPTFVQMQTLVARKKARPLMATSRQKNETVSFLLETMEECWDGDAEARLTANCVEMRLMQDWPGLLLPPDNDASHLRTGEIKREMFVEKAALDGQAMRALHEDHVETVNEHSALLSAANQGETSV